MKSTTIWMQLLGFEKNDPDKGASRYLEHIGFKPDSICGLIFHPDFVNCYGGMEHEYGLLQANCAYYGIPRNKERDRQDWTNYDLRQLIAELKKLGVGFYAGIMGVYLNDIFHHEWLSDHPEVRYQKRDGSLRSTMCLKRMADGTYYEDFFIERAVKMLVDYDFAGIHLSDAFAPTTLLYNGDYSSDMLEQFLDYTGITPPENVAATIGNNSPECCSIRAKYLYDDHREEWIRFHGWRWERFYKKLCSAVHAVGKEVWILGMYCTDPFETRYIYGLEMDKAFAAGVDCVTANILPTGVSMTVKDSPYFFHRYHMIEPLLRAQIKEGRLLNMLGVQDASEEWSVLEHQPVKLERDIYTITSYAYTDENGCRSATDGMYICLGDGIAKQDWKFLKSRIDTGFDANPEFVHSPTVLWSDTANENMLSEFIRTRRQSVHKQCYEIFKAGTPIGAAVRSEALEGFSGNLFVPNYDLLSPEEKAILVKRKQPWVGTAPKDYDLTADGISPSFQCEDQFSDYPLKAFICGLDVSSETIAEIEKFCAEDDGLPSPALRPEAAFLALEVEMPFRKLTTGFVKSCGLLLQEAMYQSFPVRSSVPMMAVRLKNGKDRLYLYNPDEQVYAHALIQCRNEPEDVKVFSHYPVMPVRFVTQSNTGFAFDYTAKVAKNNFQIKITPAGVTIVDVTGL